MLVTAISDADTIAVTRAFGTVAAAAGLAGDSIYIVGNASEENSGARNVNSTQSTPVTNYTLV